MSAPASRLAQRGFLAPCGHLQLGADVVCHGGEVIVNEMPDAVMRDVPEFRPVAQRADGGFLVFRENPAEAKADDVRELVPTGQGS